MLLKLDLEGILVSLQIRDYQKVSQDDGDSTWCKVDFSFVSEPWLQYQRTNDEVFLAREIDDLADVFEKLFTDQITEPTEFICIEPDFRFQLYPKYDVRENPKVIYVQPGCEMVDIYVEWEVSIWNNGFTGNYLSLCLNRRDIECLLTYFQLISGRITMENPVVKSLLEKGTILS